MWRVLYRPSGCALVRDAHHNHHSLATATTLTAHPTHLEGKPREPRERGERTGPQVGMDVASSYRQVYYLCFTCSGAQRARPTALARVDLLLLHLAAGEDVTVKRSGVSLFRRCWPGVRGYFFAGIPGDTLLRISTRVLPRRMLRRISYCARLGIRKITPLLLRDESQIDIFRYICRYICINMQKCEKNSS